MEPHATWKQERIAELERQLAEAMAAAQAEDRGSAESARVLERIGELSAELGEVLQADPQPFANVEMSQHAEAFGGMGADSPYSRWTEPLRRTPGRIVAVVVIGILGAAGVAAIFADRGKETSSAADSDKANAVITVPRGGQLRVGANSGAKKVVACNDGNLTLYGTGIFSVTGHCASLTTGAIFSQVSVESVDAVNITGYDTEYFITGDGAALTVTNNRNKVHIDSIDSVNISGNDNTVSYKSGSPEVADKGQGNVVTAEK